MADISYTVNQDLPENIEGFEQYSQEDKNLVGSFQINSTFNPDKNYSELHILSLSDELLESDYFYSRYTQLGNAQSAGQEGVSILTIDPIADSRYYSYDGAGVKLLYHFLDDLYTDDNTSREFYIQDISPDRTEIVLNSLNITEDQVVNYTSTIKDKLDNQSYFAGFRLNFKENDLIIATNIDTIDSGTQKLVAVKLYEPLPDIYNLKSTLTVVEIVSDSIVYEVDSEYVIEPEQLPTLRSANFNIEIADDSTVPTEYFNYNELFSYPVSNANNEVYSAINEKGIKVNVNYTDFNEFIHFSSAEERLLNFKYKVDLLSSYSTSISSSQAATTGLQGISGSRAYYEGLITGVVSNFDHYERFLYYESGSGCWPKSNTTKPYTNKASNTPEAITWFAAQRSQATYYDQTNYNSLINSIPTYLRDDTNNDAYLTFIYMIGQHFDNLWLYAKAVTDKYDGDNRLDKGISRDLVGEALKNFGVKLYTSNKSLQDLFSTFVGQAYQSGSENINNYIVASPPESTTVPLPSVTIGSQTWTTRNLDVTTYRDGTSIPEHTGTGAEWIALTRGAWCYPDNNPVSGSVYGKLYNWYALQGIYDNDSLNDPNLRKQIAPTGWHVPNDEEWQTLTGFVGSTPGVKLRSTNLWVFNAGTEGTDNFGFTALPAGHRQTNFTSPTTNARFWTSTQDTTGHYRSLNYNETTVRTTTSALFHYGHSIRLVLDPPDRTMPLQPSYDDYQKEVQKRIYHNLPLLLKSKGTERGLRALINCFGIPGDVLQIKLYGGKNTAQLPFFGNSQYVTSSLDKIRLDNTGSIISGSTLSSHTSIVKRDKKYTDDLHAIEIGFSPTDNIDAYIVSKSAATFNLDDYLGDPRNLYSDSYSGLLNKANTILSSSLGTMSSYDLRDYVRLIKFFDNTVFKMVNDFIPARSNADIGVIIKPNILNVSKAKSVSVSATQPEHSGSINTAFISGSDGSVYKQSKGSASTSYADLIQTPQGLSYRYLHTKEESTFDGELSNSYIKVSSRDLNKDNLLKYSTPTAENQTVSFYDTIPSFVCALSSPSPLPITITRDNQTKDVVNDLVDNFFSGVTFVSSSNIPKNSSGLYVFPNTNYRLYSVTASRAAIAFCSSSASYLTQYCDIAPTSEILDSIITQSAAVNLTTWFTSGSNISASFTASWNNGASVQNIATPTSYLFTQPAGTIVNIAYRDPLITKYTCQQSQDITILPIPIQNVVPYVSIGNQRTGDGGSFVSSSTEISWTLQCNYNSAGRVYWSNSPGTFQLTVQNTPAPMKIKYQLVQQVNSIQSSRFVIDGYYGPTPSLNIEISSANPTAESSVVTLPVGVHRWYFSIHSIAYQDASYLEVGTKVKATVLF